MTDVRTRRWRGRNLALAVGALLLSSVAAPAVGADPVPEDDGWGDATATPRSLSSQRAWPDASEHLEWPIDGVANSPVGLRWHPIHQEYRMHQGRDIAAPAGRQVYASFGGTVSRSQTGPKCGGDIIIDHPGGYSTRYLHVNRGSSPLVVGQTVTAGQPIATVESMAGLSTDCVTGPHLHFEVWRYGTFIDWDDSIPVGTTVSAGTDIPVDFPGLDPEPPAPPPLPRRAALSAGRDYNEDGKDDILWYGAGDGADSLWFGDSPAGQFDKGAITGIGGDYLPVGGDFNGDGQADVFWYSPGSGAEYVWYHYTGRTFLFGPPKTASGDPTSVAGRYTPVPGDFNGDGRDDIFWYGVEGGPESIWYGRDDARFTVSSAPQVSRSGLRPIPGDFEGDHRTDIFWYAPGTDADALWRGSSSSAQFIPVSIDNVTGSYSPVAGDFNGDGKDDIYWYALGGNNDSLWSFTGVGTYTSSSTHDAAGLFIPIAGDFDGNGRDDIFWYCPGTYDDFAWYFTSSGKTSTNQTVNGDYRPT